MQSENDEISSNGPLAGVMVLDFTALLPGPLATLMLAEAGAEVIRIERPGDDKTRGNQEKWDEAAVRFALLNRGKKSLVLDLKSPQAMNILRPLIARADIIIEQFRPGVMGRLGLGFDAVKEIKSDIIYCSVTGYGQTGPKAMAAGHDLNYLALSGVLASSYGQIDQPVVPPTLVADVGGGTYPAVVNILLALRNRDKTGRGCHIDVAMAEGVFTFAYRAFAKGVAMEEPVRNSGELLTGGSPRYKLYPASDNRVIAVGAIEQKFWDAFCEAIGLDQEYRQDNEDPIRTTASVARIIASKPSGHWVDVFEKADCCCTIVRNMTEVKEDAHFAERGLFNRFVKGSAGQSAPALPVPISADFRADENIAVAVPDFGEHNDELSPGKNRSTENTIDK